MMEGDGQVPAAHAVEPEVAHLVAGGGAARLREGWAHGMIETKYGRPWAKINGAR